jgi:glutamine amidotransferase
MGWNSIAKSGNIRTQDCPIFKGLPDNIYVYFVHSYYPKPKNDNIIATTTNYGVTFCSSLWKDNIYAMQFHPEKSQRMGLRIIENFVDL